MSAFNRFDEGARDPPLVANGQAPTQRRPSQQKQKQSSPSLLDRKQPYYSGIQRFGLAKVSLYFSDPFHTALNLPWWKFIIVFFSTYFIEFFFFSLLYYSQPHRCIPGITNFSHALWISSRVASTIGFNAPLVPNPNCAETNLLVMANVICSSLIDFVMLGLVFARFSAPFKRATTIRFSRHAVAYRHSSGYWCLSFRIANVRKHQVLNPEIKVMLTAVDSITPADYIFEYLEPHEVHRDATNLQLGFPANLVHIIRPGTPLWSLSLQEMETRLMEILIFVDSIDAMTAKHMQARKAYYAGDIFMNAQLLPMHLTRRGGKVGMDFTDFDTVVPATEDLLAEYQTSPELRTMPMAEVAQHMSHLRHLTFRRLTEQHAGTPAGAAPTGRKGSSGALSGGGAAAAAANPFQAKEVELVPVALGDSSGVGARDQDASYPVLLQLHSICDALLADPSSTPAIRNQAAAAKNRYPARADAGGRFESIGL